MSSDDPATGKKRRCCGEPEPAQPLPGPAPPGWHPGDKPPVNPLEGATSDADLRQRFDQAVRDLLRSAGTARGPQFGPRKNAYLPYLVIRAFGGDHGARPVTVTFWESPDIFVVPNLAAEAAPPAPPTRGGLAQAGVPNTLWAHVWNLGRAPVFNARVEFYWFDPTLGFSAGSANLIGVAHVDLGDRTSGRAHTIVKCPTTWVPAFVNGGHECLVVRCFDPLTDPLGPNPWTGRDDRHVGQRNIHVANTASPGVAQIALRLGCATPPGPATLEVVPTKVADVGWLAVLAGKRAGGLRDAVSFSETYGIMYPTLLRPAGDRPNLTGIGPQTTAGILRGSIQFERGCDELEAIFYAGVDGLQPGECRVYRVQQTASGSIAGGFTVIVQNSPIGGVAGQSVFFGRWIDQGGNHATITGADGKVFVQYTDVSRGPFSGDERHPANAAANITVNFSDVNVTITGELQDAGQSIRWANGSVWQRIPERTGGGRGSPLTVTIQTPATTTTQRQVQLTAIASDPSGSALTFQWSSDRSAAQIHGGTAIVDFQLAEGPGPYVITVKVTNAAGLSATASITINFVGR